MISLGGLLSTRKNSLTKCVLPPPQLVSLQEAKLLLKEDDELIKEVFDYWTRKRKNCKSGSLIPTVKQEKRDGSSTSDPYVAFRRRTEKMQTRKVRLEASSHNRVFKDPAVTQTQFWI